MCLSYSNCFPSFHRSIVGLKSQPELTLHHESTPGRKSTGLVPLRYRGPIQSNFLTLRKSQLVWKLTRAGFELAPYSGYRFASSNFAQINKLTSFTN